METTPKVRIQKPALTVHCRECEREGQQRALRAARVENGELVFEVVHHGRTHVNRIDLAYLQRLLAA